jgi:Zn ribbon nucleic-acid-binding protein
MIAWGVRAAGGRAIRPDQNTVWVVDASAVPVVVRAPRQLGGAEARVERAVAGRCPLCDAETRHLLFRAPHERLAMSECSGCGFVWYERHASDVREGST